MTGELSEEQAGASPRITVVIGLGYVGLPLAVESTIAGMKTFGIDVDSAKVQRISDGDSPSEDVSKDRLENALHVGFEATADFEKVSAADVVVICVPTPLGENGDPDLTYVVSATQMIAPHLRPGVLVVLESTSYPGTTEEVVMPIIQQYLPVLDDDFFLAFSPERIDPGNADFSVSNTPRVVGGASAQSADMAKKFYEAFVSNVVVLSGTREAEMAKLIENTYRHVNIALVNELAIVCHELGIDVWEAIRGAATKPFGYQKFTPGVGVGGHCIPIDPMYLDNRVKAKLGYGLEFIGLAQKINDSMPQYVAGRVIDIIENQSTLGSRRVLLMGVTYKAGVADTRETPARPLARSLIEAGLEVSFHDPHVLEFRLEDGLRIARENDWERELANYSAAVLLQPHEEYLESTKSWSDVNLLDCTGKLTKIARFVL